VAIVSPAFSPDAGSSPGPFRAGNAASPQTPDAWAVSSGEPVGQPEWTTGRRGLENASFPWAPNELQAWRTLRTPEAVARAAAYTGEGRFFTSDGERVVAIRHGPWPQGMSTLQLIRTQDGVELLRRQTQGIFRFGASADGRWLATTDSRGELHVLALPSGQERALQVPGDGGSPTSRPAASAVAALAFSADGSRLALSLGRSVSIVDTARMSQVLGIPTATGSVRRLLFSPDGRRLAAQVSNGVRLWDAATGRESSASRQHPPHHIAVDLPRRAGPRGRDLRAVGECHA
jgi:WD40 repeat protein